MKEKVDLNVTNGLPKGRVTVELKDATTGEIKEKFTGENYISKNFQKYFYKQAVVDLFVRSIHNASSDNVLGGLDKRIWLTDNKEPENPEDPYMRGNIIGWADWKGGYSGDNELRGTINPEDSFVDENMIRVVFDFPIDTAVGEIDSIYNSLSSHVVNYNRTRHKTGNYMKSTWLIPFEDGYLTRAHNFSYVQKLNSTMQKSGEGIQSHDWVSGSCAIWHNGALYGVYQDMIYVLKQLGSSEFYYVSNRYNLLSGLVKCQDRIFSTGRKSREEKVGVIEFDSNFNEVGHYPFPEYSNSLPSGKSYLTDQLWYDEKWNIIGGEYWNSTFDIRTKTFSYNSGTNTGGIRFNGEVAIEDHDSSLVWQPVGNYISRYLLPRTINKGENDILKIYYDFFYEGDPFNPFLNVGGDENDMETESDE